MNMEPMNDTGIPRRISLHQPIKDRFSLDSSRHSLHKPLSNRSLIDSIPKTPNRLPSPNGKSGRRLSTSSISNEFPGSGGSSSRMSRRSSLDAVPMVPSRFLSPVTKEGLVVKIPDQAKDALTMSPFPDKENRLQAAVRVPNPPLAPTESSSSSSSNGNGSTAVVSEADSRSAILSKLPQHIKDQLSIEDWYKILEPTMLTGAVCASVKSDISDDLSNFVPATSDRVRDDLEGADEGSISDPKLTEQKNGGNRFMDSQISANEALACTEDEAEQQEYEDVRQFPELDEPQAGQASESAKKQKKRVSFGKANVRYHERVLVVHPSTSSGPSVGIGWDYSESEEAIEWNNQTSEEMRLTRRDREAIVNELGYSQRDVAKAIRETLKIKNQRRRTANNLQAAVVNVEKVESIAENAQRKIRKLHNKFRIRRQT